MTDSDYTRESRAARIAKLERSNRDTVARMERQRRAFAEFQAAANAVMARYVEAATSPMRQLIADLRR